MIASSLELAVEKKEEKEEEWKVEEEGEEGISIVQRSWMKRSQLNTVVVGGKEFGEGERCEEVEGKKGLKRQKSAE